MRLLLIASLLSVSHTSFVHADPWQDTLNVIQGQYQDNYCFLELNRDSFGWDIQASMDEVRQNVTALGENPDATKARQALGRFYQSMRDIHVQPIYQTSSPYSSVHLPITMRSVANEKAHDKNGRTYFVTSIDRTVLPEANFPFQVGDEIIALGNRPIQSWVNEMLPSVYAHRATQQTLAEIEILDLGDYRGKIMPTGDVTLTIRRQQTQAKEQYTLTWITTLKTSSIHQHSLQEQRRSAGRGMMTLPEQVKDTSGFSDTHYSGVAEKHYSSIGDKAPFFYDLGKVIWHSVDTEVYYAYISQLDDGKKIGFVRVPTYYPDNIYNVAVPAFYALVDRFVDAGISVMVYDQTNNGGGSLLYTYDLMSALIDQPADPKMTTEWIVNPIHYELSIAWQTIHDTAVRAKTDPAALLDLQTNYFNDKIVDQDFVDSVIAESTFMLATVADPSHGRLAKPFPFEGVTLIKPKPGKHYTGPILMLNNELSVSAADLSPSLFQNMKRAQFFGVTTAGAGAYQNGFLSPDKNPFELYYNSISFGKFNNAKGHPIQGNGVKADFHYEVTAYDLTHDMIGYRDALAEVLKRFY